MKGLYNTQVRTRNHRLGMASRIGMLTLAAATAGGREG